MDVSQLYNELAYKTMRSSGPGGQHANKTSTKVVLNWSLTDSEVFTEEQKERLHWKLNNRLTKDKVPWSQRSDYVDDDETQWL